MEGYIQLVQKVEDTHISDNAFLHSVCDLPIIYEHKDSDHMAVPCDIVDPSLKRYNGIKRLYVLEHDDVVCDLSKIRIKTRSSNDLNRIFSIELYCGGCECKVVNSDEINSKLMIGEKIPEYICDFSSILNSINVNPLRDVQYGDVGFSVVFTGNTPLDLSFYVGKGISSDFGPNNNQKLIKLKYNAPLDSQGNSIIKCKDGLIGLKYYSNARPRYYINENIPSERFPSNIGLKLDEFHISWI